MCWPIAVGTHLGDTLIHLAVSENEAIRCWHGIPNELQEAAQFASTASSIVLDLTAAITLLLLDLDDRIGDWPAHFITSSATLCDLRDFRDSYQDKSKGWVVPTNTNLGIRFIEIPEEEHQRRYERINCFIDHVTNATESRDCFELADLPSETRDEMINFFDQHDAESILLARNPGYILWTDDFTVAAYSQKNLVFIEYGPKQC